jgi:hypothetical protein
MLAGVILHADFIDFLVGREIDEFSRNPLRPKNLSILRRLVEVRAQLIRGLNKAIVIEYS